MSAPLLARRRYAHSGPFIKTNHKFGDDLAWFPSTYAVDYSPSQIQGRNSMRRNVGKQPDPPVNQQQAQYGRIKNISEDEWLNDTTPRVPAMSKEKVTQISSNRKSQKSNVKFGNDPPERLTAYAEFARHFGKFKNVAGRLCSPPQLAEVLPLASGGRDAPRSTVGSDFTYMGPGIADQVHERRLGDLHIVKDTHVSDSVAYTLKQARPPRMMTRSMVDYRPPKERLCGNISDIVRHKIAPEVRMDSIWTSIGDARNMCGCTETRQNYAWPLASKPTKRYQRGQMNKVR